MEYKLRYNYFFAHKQEEYHVNYRKLLLSMPVGIFILNQKTKRISFYNEIVAKLAKAQEDQRSSSEMDVEEIITEQDVMNVIDNFKQKRGDKTLGEVIRSWKSDTFDDKYKYKYNNNGYKLVCTIKGLRLTLRSQESEVFFLEDQTAFEDLLKLESKYQKLYVASIVHDIRSPLNGVMGMIEKIDTIAKNSKVANYVDIARKTCQLLLFLTYDITDYSQLEANKFKANLKGAQIREILDEVAELLSFSFKTKGLACNIVVEDSVPVQVLIDKHRYTQILLNIMTNALKFTFKGSITVEASYDAATNQLITSVTDTGIGIKAEDVSHLFKLFGKLESSSDMNPQGVGLGLAMCKKLSEKLGGSIGVKSVPGKGSTFTFSVSANLCSRRMTSMSSTSINEKCPNVIELPAKVAAHTLRLDRFKREALADKKISTAFTSKNLLVSSETSSTPMLESDKCNCNKILIIDDDYYNLLVLQNYLQTINLTADTVTFNHKY
jgi:two-component sensor histidine kinase